MTKYYTMKYNAILKRKHFFEPITTILEMDFPPGISLEEKERLAAIDLIIKAGISVELEPINPIEKPYCLSKTEI